MRRMAPIARVASSLLSTPQMLILEDDLPIRTRSLLSMICKDVKYNGRQTRHLHRSESPSECLGSSTALVNAELHFPLASIEADRQKETTKRYPLQVTSIFFLIEIQLLR